MAASKDIYESHQYRANIYAAGIWRGLGVTVSTPFSPTGRVIVGPRYGGVVSVGPRYKGQVKVNA